MKTKFGVLNVIRLNKEEVTFNTLDGSLMNRMFQGDAFFRPTYCGKLLESKARIFKLFFMNLIVEKN